MTIGGGVYPTATMAVEAAMEHFYSRPLDPPKTSPKLGTDFGVYPANTNPKVWVWEAPARK